MLIEKKEVKADYLVWGFFCVFCIFRRSTQRNIIFYGKAD